MNNNKNKDSLGKVKKLAYIVTLDNMLKSYDELNKQDVDGEQRADVDLQKRADSQL